MSRAQRKPVPAIEAGAAFAISRRGVLGKLRFPSFSSAAEHVRALPVAVRSQFCVRRAPYMGDRP